MLIPTTPALSRSSMDVIPPPETPRQPSKLSEIWKNNVTSMRRSLSTFTIPKPSSLRSLSIKNFPNPFAARKKDESAVKPHKAANKSSKRDGKLKEIHEQPSLVDTSTKLVTIVQELSLFATFHNKLIPRGAAIIHKTAQVTPSSQSPVPLSTIRKQDFQIIPQLQPLKIRVSETERRQEFVTGLMDGTIELSPSFTQKYSIQDLLGDGAFGFVITATRIEDGLEVSFA